MAEPVNEVDLTDKEELEKFIKESGIENLITAMKKGPSKPKKTSEFNKNIDWIIRIIKTFRPVHLNLKSHYVVLAKLIDYMGNKNFSGCIFVYINDNTSIMFIWQGELIGIINNKLDKTDEEAFRYIRSNYRDASIDVYLPPKEKAALPLLLNSQARNDIEPKHKDLDTEFTNLPKLITKMEGEKFTGYIELKKPDGKNVAYFYKGKDILTIFLHTDGKYTVSTLDELLKTSGNVDIYPGLSRTLIGSMHDLMSKITILVMNRNEDASTLSKIVESFDKHISLNIAEATRDNTELKVTMPAGIARKEDNRSVQGQIKNTLEFKFVRYFFSDYFFSIAETGNNVSMKKIWNNIPRVRTVKFYQKFHEGHVEHDFDIIMEDGSGNILFAMRHTERAPKAYEIDIFVKQLENIKHTLNDWGSLKAGIFISTSGFEEEALTSAKKVTATGAGVKSVFGKMGGSKVPKMLVAPKGFIRTENNGGFHLCLISQDDDSFEVDFPKL